MKQFSCADVVPGCTATFRAGSVDELLAHGTLHARFAHDLAEPELPAEVVTAIRAAAHDVD